MAKLREGSVAREIVDAEQSRRNFWRELDHRCLDKGLEPGPMALSSFTGVTDQSIRNYRQDRRQMQINTMQELIRALRPDIRVVLKFLGYSDKDIRAFAEVAAK